MEVMVDYHTKDGLAKAVEDYEVQSGRLEKTLSFLPVQEKPSMGHGSVMGVGWLVGCVVCFVSSCLRRESQGMAPNNLRKFQHDQEMVCVCWFATEQSQLTVIFLSNITITCILYLFLPKTSRTHHWCFQIPYMFLCLLLLLQSQKAVWSACAWYVRVLYPVRW